MKERRLVGSPHIHDLGFMKKEMLVGVALTMLGWAGCQFGHAPSVGSHHVAIWHKASVKFTPGIDPDSVQLEDGTYRLDAGRILLKPIVVPDHARRCDARLDVTVTSAGDPWDKSGTLFAMANSRAEIFWNACSRATTRTPRGLQASFVRAIVSRPLTGPSHAKVGK